MNYTVLNHNYQNTGGGCMVSSFMIYDSTAKRTLFVLCTEEGGTIATADYIMNDIEYSDDLVIDMANFYELKPTDDYFELYRECLAEHVKKDCQYFSSTICVPYILLADELKNQLSVDYINWHESELGDQFETDGTRIIYNKEYIDMQKGTDTCNDCKEEVKETKTFTLALEDVAVLREKLYELLDMYEGGEEYNVVKDLLSKL